MRVKSLSPEEGRKLSFQFFGVALPLTRDELKSQFRSACKRLHTDTSGSDTKDKFIAMKAFYDQLCDQNPSWAFSDGGKKEILTTSGDRLSDLGLGMPPNKNGRDCTDCNHKGYQEREVGGVERCSWCMMGWAYSQPCRRCKGTGKFSNKAGKVVGECFNCKGSGIHQCNSVTRCAVCKGQGYKIVPTGVEYVVCASCQGVGEIEIYNPVIPKGRL